MPTERPRTPRISAQPKRVVASIPVHGASSRPRTRARHSSGMAAKSSKEGMETTAPRIPSDSSCARASTATDTSEPVAIRVMRRGPRPASCRTYPPLGLALSLPACWRSTGQSCRDATAPWDHPAGRARFPRPRRQVRLDDRQERRASHRESGAAHGPRRRRELRAQRPEGARPSLDAPPRRVHRPASMRHGSRRVSRTARANDQEPHARHPVFPRPRARGGFWHCPPWSAHQSRYECDTRSWTACRSAAQCPARHGSRWGRARSGGNSLPQRPGRVSIPAPWPYSGCLAACEPN